MKKLANEEELLEMLEWENFCRKFYPDLLKKNYDDARIKEARQEYDKYVKELFENHREEFLKYIGCIYIYNEKTVTPITKEDLDKIKHGLEDKVQYKLADDEEMKEQFKITEITTVHNYGHISIMTRKIEVPYVKCDGLVNERREIFIHKDLDKNNTYHILAHEILAREYGETDDIGGEDIEIKAMEALRYLKDFAEDDGIRSKAKAAFIAGLNHYFTCLNHEKETTGKKLAKRLLANYPIFTDFVKKEFTQE